MSQIIILIICLICLHYYVHSFNNLNKNQDPAKYIIFYIDGIHNDWINCVSSTKFNFTGCKIYDYYSNYLDTVIMLKCNLTNTIINEKIIKCDGHDIYMRVREY
jgi:hypothetical protein